MDNDIALIRLDEPLEEYRVLRLCTADDIWNNVYDLWKTVEKLQL